MRNVTGNRGSIKLFLILIIVAAVGFVGISFGKPYFRYNTLRSHTKDLLEMQLDSPESLKKKILADAEELHIPLDEEDVEVTTHEKTTTVKISWSETVDFWGYYSKKLDFTIDEVY